jgi:hypothetical protein
MKHIIQGSDTRNELKWDAHSRCISIHIWYKKINDQNSRHNMNEAMQ